MLGYSFQLRSGIGGWFFLNSIPSILARNLLAMIILISPVKSLMERNKLDNVLNLSYI